MGVNTGAWCPSHELRDHIHGPVIIADCTLTFTSYGGLHLTIYPIHVTHARSVCPPALRGSAPTPQGVGVRYLKAPVKPPMLNMHLC